MSAGPSCHCVAMFGCTVIAVPWNCTCPYVSCHCNARLADEVEFMYRNQETEAVAIGECVDMLFTELVQPMPDAHQQMCSGKGSAKGRPLRVPQMGDEDGPKWIEDGWVFGYKLWVGDLPSDISRVSIGEHCHGQVDISVQSHRTQSGMAYAIITFIDQALAIKAFEQLSMAKFLHGNGTAHWPTVKWFRSAKRCPSEGQQANAQHLPHVQV